MNVPTAGVVLDHGARPASTMRSSSEEVIVRRSAGSAPKQARSSARQAACGAQGRLEPERPRTHYPLAHASRRVPARVADDGDGRRRRLLQWHEN
jgi:hypothetical protein